jgi:tetratricopeptide (TPR) repeat protein
MNDHEVFGLEALKLTLLYLGYRSYPLPAADLVRFEGALGVLVPSGYREFLLFIGFGAGPHTLWRPGRILAELGLAKKGEASAAEESATLHDLRLLLEASENIEDLEAFLEADDVEEVREIQQVLLAYHRQRPGPPLPSRPFCFTRAQAEVYNRSVPEESNRPWLSGPYPADGCIPIADDGGVVYYVLAVTGDAAGSVWEVTGEVLLAWRPARRPRGIYWSQGRNPLPALSATPSFLEWYCSWVEQLLVDRCPDPGGYLSVGLSYQGMGKYAKAVENWDKAIQMTPGNSLAYYYRGMALQGLQQEAEAAENFKRCLAQNPDPWTVARAEQRLRSLGAI